mgnify:CR=1 FL=1
MKIGQRKKAFCSLMFGLLCWASFTISRAAQGPGVGFPLGYVSEATLLRLERPGSRYRLSVLPKERSFEILPITQGYQRKVLLSCGRKAWIPLTSIVRASHSYQLDPGSLEIDSRDLRFVPVHDLPSGVEYQWLHKEGAKLHICRIDLRENPSLSFSAYVVARHNKQIEGLECRNSISSFVERTSAILGINGTFFRTAPRSLYGEPLGNVIINGGVAFELSLVSVLERRRSYFAWTSHSRVVLGDSPYPASVILDLNECDDFDRKQFEEGERIVSMIGGLGWLLRDFSPRAWEDGVERQFGASYYSYKVRRPQTVIGVSHGGKVVTLLSQEGYPHSRRRMTLPELAHLMAALGCEHAVFTDGGGSSEMVIRGRPVLRTENLGSRRLNSTALLLLP